MEQVAVRSEHSVTLVEKQIALAAVLQSNTFARADQLKSFLKFVCEMEFAGRGVELSEYMIGVEALGRPQSYSPGDDSAVRNRAFALRKKLQEFYNNEYPTTTLRIELMKGSYCPHFVVNHSLPADTENEQVLPDALALHEPETEIISTPARKSFLKSPLVWLSLSLFGSAILAVGAVLFVRTKLADYPLRSPVPPIAAEAWGPILVPNVDVMICVANPPSFSVHPISAASVAPSPMNSFKDSQALSPEMQRAYRQKYPASTESDFSLTLTTNATYWGDTFGAVVALRTALAAGSLPQLFPEKVVKIPTLRRRNVIIFGAPEYSPTVAHFLEKCPLTVVYLNSIMEQQAGKPLNPLYIVNRDQKNRQVLVYGLITVLPSESASQDQHRTIIFSGTHSAGTQAAAEYFAAPDHLKDLKIQLQKDGHDTFPPAYQVVIKAEVEDSILMNFKYETYRIIPNHTSE